MLAMFVFETVLCMGIWFACILVSFVPIYFLGPQIRNVPLPLPLLFVLLGGVVAWCLMWRWQRTIHYFRRSVPAKCPVCNQVAAFARGRRPIRYDCTFCQATTQTWIYERGGGNDDFLD